MRKLVWTPAVVAALAILACSSSNKGSGNAFPYSGPSCANGAPGATNAACSSCGENACSSASETTCVNTSCSSYFSCFCACNVGDGNCLQGCQSKQSSDCMSCLGAVTTCYQNALATTCASQCAATGSSGGGGSSSGGGTATGTCATLASCCGSIPGGSGASQGCTTVANTNNATACQLILSGLQDGGICH
jgi:hypothetical protein